MYALKELGIISPLLETKLSKDEIRELSRRLSLPTHDKPAYSCLMTRFPFGEHITPPKLKMVEKAEVILHSFGIKHVRVRIHDTLGRIEIPRDRFIKFVELPLSEIICEMKKIGFSHITLDLEGYKMGSFNNKEGEKSNGQN